PRERCINEVTSNQRTLNALIAETQANIDRGYALAERSEVVTIDRTCTQTLESGEQVRFPCDEVMTREYKVPVAIDLNAEQAKLQSLLQRREAMASTVQDGINQCVAIHPE
ncbi:MAG: hypothetical protein HWD81_01945, partial [Marivivens sp.]|nr:hypothetical protein [Marivivens sp.]